MRPISVRVINRYQLHEGLVDLDFGGRFDVLDPQNEFRFVLSHGLHEAPGIVLHGMEIVVEGVSSVELDGVLDRFLAHSVQFRSEKKQCRVTL